MKAKLSVILLLLSFSAVGREDVKNVNSVPNAIANTAVALLQSVYRSDVPKDSISGRCTFKGSSCNGAEVSLFKNDKRVYHTTITSPEEFKIQNLKRNESYLLRLVWKKQKVIEERTVNPGQFINISLEKE